MKLFDLTAALKGAPVVTRHGLKVTEIFHLKTTTKRKLVIVVNGVVRIVNESGRSSIEIYDHHPLDLFMDTVKHEEWGIYDTKSQTFCGEIFPSEKEAKEYIAPQPGDRDISGEVVIFKIREWEE